MFFSDEVGHVFEPFSWLHFLLFAIIIVGSLLIYHFQEEIRNFKHERTIAKAMALFALFWEFSLYMCLYTLCRNGSFVLQTETTIHDRVFLDLGSYG